MATSDDDKDLKQTIEDELKSMLKKTTEPSEGRMKLLKLATGFLAVQAKLEETTYGEFFEDDGLGTAGGVSERAGAKPAARRRAPGNGSAGEPSLPGLDAS